MADYKGNTCPVCKQKFKEADDIVVCPDCGTPYHRECWKKVGVCVHQADHAAGFEWTPDNVISDRPDDIVCPNCGTHNPLGAKYCNHCGVSLPDHPDNVQYQQDHPAPGGNGPVYANGSYQAGDAPQYRQAPRQEQAPDQEFFSAGSMGPDGFTCKEVGPDDPIDGIKAQDWASYVGPSSIYYMMQFFRIFPWAFLFLLPQNVEAGCSFCAAGFYCDAALPAVPDGGIRCGVDGGYAVFAANSHGHAGMLCAELYPDGYSRPVCCVLV